MNHLWEFPPSTIFGRILPKNKIYERSKAGSRIRELFVREVEQITWLHKLAPETIHVPVHADVAEIQVLSIRLKDRILSEEVLRVIDRAIPSPIWFHLSFGHEQRYAATYKQPNEADRTKWVIGDYFWSPWMDNDAPRCPLPLALDLRVLYLALLAPLLPLPQRGGETFESCLERLGQLQAWEREAQRLEVKLVQEKQFNRKVEIHGQLLSLQQKMKELRQNTI
jgi:hypothetical protein